MTTEWSIASVTIAYNSAETLRKQLNALQRQNRPLKEIIVVDNGSKDSTVGMIRSEYPQVTVLELGENLGIGAALAAGLSYAALEKKYDWTWILDQDSLPESNSVEHLLRGYSLTEQKGRKVGVVACFPVHRGSGLSYPGLFWRGRLVPPPAAVLRQPIWFVDATISSGTMVRRDVVEAVGLPRSDFFMDLVDVEYCLRIRRYGYEIAIVRDSILHHTIGTPQTFQFLGYKKAWNDHAPWREYYISRNHTYIVWHRYPNFRSKMFMLMRLVHHGMGILFFSQHRVASFAMMLKGFFDGRAGRLGRRFFDGASDGSRATAVALSHTVKSQSE
jgi:GT2 family glycosyltransferase